MTVTSNHDKSPSDQDRACSRPFKNIPLTFPITLTDKFRLVDDPLQWILQQASNGKNNSRSPWRSVSFCGTKKGLLLTLREKVPDCPKDIYDQIAHTFQDYHD